MIFGSVHVSDGSKVMSLILRDCEKPAFYAIRLFHTFHAIRLFHASCDTPCIMLHAIRLVLYFMRYALYHVSCDTLVS